MSPREIHKRQEKAVDILDLKPASDVPLLTPREEFKPGLKGAVRFSAKKETSEGAIIPTIRHALGDLAESRGYDGIPFTLAVGEFTTNAVKHGCEFNPEKEVHIRWEIGDNEASLTVTNEGSRLFYPARFLDRPPERIIEQRVPDRFGGTDLHEGTDMIVKLGGEITYLWEMWDGSRIVTTLKTESGEAKLSSYRETSEGKKEEIDLKAIVDEGSRGGKKPDMSKSLKVKVVFRKE